MTLPKKTELVATLMDQDQSPLLLPQPHNLNPDTHHMCVSSGKMNSTWEYMVRKFIAHAWDKPSGVGGKGGGGGGSPYSPSLVSIRLGRAVSQTIGGEGVRPSGQQHQQHVSIQEREISFLTSGIFPLQF